MDPFRRRVFSIFGFVRPEIEGRDPTIFTEKRAFIAVISAVVEYNENVKIPRNSIRRSDFAIKRREVARPKMGNERRPLSIRRPGAINQTRNSGV